MNKFFVSIIIFSIILSGCTFGDPENYTLLIFKGKSEDWEGEMEYVDSKEGEHPENLLKLNFTGEEVNSSIDVTIENSHIAQDISLSEFKNVSIELNESEISKIVESKKNQDNAINDSIEVKISWDDKQEIIQLIFNTSVQRDGRDL